MRRRARIDLSQTVNAKEAAQLERKGKRWAQVNRNLPDSENPFLAAIKPDCDNYGEPGEDSQQLRARLESLEFGNYPGYFNYRNKAAAPTVTGLEPPGNDAGDPAIPLEAGLSDKRLALMKEEWFRGKRVLDIGCNRGHITYAIAKLFSPQFILGIDIDLKMIHMANRDLHLHLEDGLLKQNDLLRLERACELYSSEMGGHDDAEAEAEADKREYIEDQDHVTLSSYVNVGPLATSIASTLVRESAADGYVERGACGPPQEEPAQPQEVVGHETGRHTRASPSRGIFPNNILFVEHNYVLARDELVEKQSACFDTIICLSVTKWIHLNYRDEGLRRFLRRIHRHLVPGGLLVLEAQPFDNYYRKKKLSDRLRSNYYSIQFKPEQIDEFLLSNEVGFREILFSTLTEHECAGFKRPLKVFLK